MSPELISLVGDHINKGWSISAIAREPNCFDIWIKKIRRRYFAKLTPVRAGVDKSEVRRLIQKGLNNAEIARACACTKQYIRTLRVQMQFPQVKRGRPKIDTERKVLRTKANKVPKPQPWTQGLFNSAPLFKPHPESCGEDTEDHEYRLHLPVGNAHAGAE